MKFQKGILSDPEPKPQPKPAVEMPVAVHPTPSPRPALSEIEKNRLFETQEEFEGSSRSYLKIFAVVVGLIIVAAVAIFYLTLPGVGDRVRAPAGLEDAVREHFLSKEKRTATDVVVYQCDGFYWANVGVETRKDIANPLYKIDTYTARIVAGPGESWQVTANPAASEDQRAPCK
jgi:hypothetical protein